MKSLNINFLVHAIDNDNDSEAGKSFKISFSFLLLCFSLYFLLVGLEHKVEIYTEVEYAMHLEINFLFEGSFDSETSTESSQNTCCIKIMMIRL